MSAASIEANKQRQGAARDVVERARAGDQVAMGLLAMVRDNAKNGDPRARQSMRAIEKYIGSHPPTSIGTEASDITNPPVPAALDALWKNPTSDIVIKALPLVGFWPGAVALSHGARLDNAKVNEIAAHVPEPHQLSFKGGVAFWKRSAPLVPGSSPKGWALGRIVGIARSIQRLQLPNVPISSYCPVTGWELGE